MKLGARTYGQNDVRQVRVSYRDWLQRGAVITSATVQLPAGIGTTLGVLTYSPDKTQVWFFLHCTSTAENFVATITVTDSLGQEITDQLAFTVSLPAEGNVALQPIS